MREFLMIVLLKKHSCYYRKFLRKLLVMKESDLLESAITALHKSSSLSCRHRHIRNMISVKKILDKDCINKVKSALISKNKLSNYYFSTNSKVSMPPLLSTGFCNLESKNMKGMVC